LIRNELLSTSALTHTHTHFLAWNANTKFNWKFNFSVQKKKTNKKIKNNAKSCCVHEWDKDRLSSYTGRVLCILVAIVYSMLIILISPCTPCVRTSIRPSSSYLIQNYYSQKKLSISINIYVCIREIDKLYMHGLRTVWVL
jgi:hypothetical protein